MLVEWFETVAPHAPYLIIGAMLILTGVGFPVPEEIIIITGGYLAGSGFADPWLMLPLLYVCAMIADNLLFNIARRYGRYVTLLPMIRRFVTPARLYRMERRIEAHGGKFIFAMRFMPGVRAAGIFAAGMLRVPQWKFISCNGAAGLIMVTGYFFLAYLLSDNITEARKIVAQSQLTMGVIAGAAVLVGIWLFIRYRRERWQRLQDHRSKRRDRVRFWPARTKSAPPASDVE